LLQSWGEPAYRARQIFRWLHQRQAVSFTAMTDLPAALRERLAAELQLDRLAVARVTDAPDTTRKYAFTLTDGLAIESVLIPDAEGRVTACLSSEAGCAMGCQFCFTATLGLKRRLAAWEILDQFYQLHLALAHEGKKLNRVVFMGMGEPLDNLDNVQTACDILAHPDGLHFSPSRITLSTVGLPDGIRRVARELAVDLALSLNATTDEARDRLMPINRRHPLETVFAALEELPPARRQNLFLEYVLLAGVNDSLADAKRLARFARRLGGKINLIPFNPFPGCAFERPSETAVLGFQQRLIADGAPAFIRQSKGLEIFAACGMLANRNPCAVARPVEPRAAGKNEVGQPGPRARPQGRRPGKQPIRKP